MSGIYIPGMEMPDKCIKCKLMRRCGKNDLDYVCMPARIYVEDLTNAYKPRPDYCPLISVPPHGDLIDRREAIIDANERAYDFWLSDDEVNATIQFLNEQTTIISAEEGET